MKLNWVSYYVRADGYGRYSSRMVAALQRAGVDVAILTEGHRDMPDWMWRQLGVSWGPLTISCMWPELLQPVPGRHWLLSMTEGSVIPESWAKRIAAAGIERVIVPCAHNAEAFRRGGVTVPIHVVPGGTDPGEFAPVGPRPGDRPYTFLTLADRGERKGWVEVWESFYRAFGGKTTGDQDVRLIVKARKFGNPLLAVMAAAEGADARVVYRTDDVDDMAALYAEVDCVVLPSRAEGWGMPHREAAMMGLPVITQRTGGLDDGHTHEWALVVEGGKTVPIPDAEKFAQGEWRVADVVGLAAQMRRCYEWPSWAATFGRQARAWLAANQTWDHSAHALLQLIGQIDSSAISTPHVAAGG